MFRHQDRRKRHYHTSPRRGTIIAYFLVLISVLTTGLITTIALTSGTEAQMAGMTLKRDRAFYAAEAGLQHAYWKMLQDNNWRTDGQNGHPTVLTGSINGANYSVTATGPWNADVLIISTGTLNDGSSTSMKITAACTPATTVSTITMGGDFTNNGNVTIDGNAVALGNIVTSGRLDDGTGTLMAAGTVTSNGNVNVASPPVAGYTGGSLPSIDVNALIASATTTINTTSAGSTGHGSNATLNQLDQTVNINLGQGGIVYFSGANGVDFKGNVSVTGYGTIIADGPITIHNGGSLGSANSLAQVNIVTKGDLNIHGYLGVVGSLYSYGSISKDGGLNVQGLITGLTTGTSNLDTNGNFTVTRGPPPAWDPRFDPSGLGTMHLKQVTGPIFQD